jgi:dTDP-4-dehydrorhamnose reductase
LKIIITGASGIIGSEVLHAAIHNTQITEIVVLTRKPLAVSNPKLRTELHTDFLNYESVNHEFKNTTAVIWCLGVPQSQVDAQEYEKITHDFTMAAAKSMKKANPNCAFIFISGKGADPTENSKIIFGRIKGRTENSLNALGLKKLVIIRPGAIKAVNGYSNVSALYKFNYTLIALLYPIFRILAPNMMITSEQLGRAILATVFKDLTSDPIEDKTLMDLAR